MSLESLKKKSNFMSPHALFLQARPHIQTGINTRRQASRQVDMHAHMVERQAGRLAGKQAHRQAGTLISYVTPKYSISMSCVSCYIIKDTIPTILQ